MSAARIRWLAYALVWAGVIGAYFLLAHQPRVVELARLKERLRAVEQELYRAQEIAGNLSVIKKRGEMIEKKVAELEARLLPARIDRAGVERELRAVLSELRVEPASITLREPSRAGAFGLHVAEIEIDGDPLSGEAQIAKLDDALLVHVSALQRPEPGARGARTRLVLELYGR
ncbi:MAG: hypothetical protein JXR96_11920 [Deltaproteobacteria bacterium]|nr:hypothetical protein [Deltaproteobacteria bacterium]